MLENLLAHAPNLEFTLPDGTPVVRLGLIATIYFKEGYSHESKARVVACFQRFKDEFGAHLHAHFDGRYRVLTDAGFNKTAQQILGTHANEQYEWHVSSAPAATQAAEYSLSVLNSVEVHGDRKRSYLKISLPWTLLQTPDGVARFQDWLLYLCDQVKAEHGYGGLSSVLPYDFDAYMPTEYQLAQQFSGLEVDSMLPNFKRELLNHIKGVNWYTVLGERFVTQLYGEAELRHRLGQGDVPGDVAVLPYAHGLIIRAGGLPQLGAQYEPLPAQYVAVNRVVRAVRIPHPDPLHTYSPYGDCFDAESTAKWYARFDQPE
ncbi:DUF3396 domain-containing protein [Pigmentiphaga aceris]|uniref:DUF3396 domain-containing protein n=2 Tax=Pigmentiphaga aceris TaxID=1940612 RepID=A0A5C0B7V1_9BURK|nr:DUF3396 domain-containing protein [Pigmentiphaga aceris]